jgi:acetyl-CoA decarbonylase/synthase complex subunit gamma
MALTGLQIFKLLPNTNCKKCGHPTCLAFAMKLAAGKESLDKCPDATEEARAALGAASSPPIGRVTIGRGPRAVSVGEETVYFRHERTFVGRPGFFRHLERPGSADDLAMRLDEWKALRLERAGEAFAVDGVSLSESAGTPACREAAAAVAERELPLLLFAETADGATAILESVKESRPLLVPPSGVELAPFVAVAARLGIPLVVSAVDLPALADAAAHAAKAGVGGLLLEPPGRDLRELHRSLSLIRRGALDRAHPGLGYPVFLRVGAGELEKAVLGITKFASVLSLADGGGETWLPLWTLRQNVYTDPQKPLQMDPGVYAMGEPDAHSPLLVTTNFSLTYFIVSTELDAVGMPSHLAVVDTEGMSVLTAWSAGKFSGERVGH